MEFRNNLEMFILEEQLPAQVVDKAQLIEAVQFRNLNPKASFIVNSYITRLIEKEFQLLGYQSHQEYVRKLAELMKYLNNKDLFRRIIVYNNQQNILEIGVVPELKRYQTFAQSMSSTGKISLMYELGMRNTFGFFETMALKYDKSTNQESNSELNFAFPIFYNKNISLNVFSSFGNNILIEDLRKEEYSLGFGLNHSLSSSRNQELKAEANQKRLIIDPLKFNDFEYDSYVSRERSINLSYAFSDTRRLNNSLLNYQNNQFKFYLYYYPLNMKLDYRFEFKNISKVYLQKLFRFGPETSLQQKLKGIELENICLLSYMSTFSKSKSISLFDRSYLNRMRGFNLVESNIPFSKLSNPKEIVSNQFIFTNSLKLNLTHFPLFAGNPLYPFWHITNFVVAYNQGSKVFNNFSSGVGFRYLINDSTAIELLYNFYHKSLPFEGPYNKEDRFQIRVSFKD